MATISITESNIFVLVRAMFLLLIPTAEVIQGQGNRIPMPRDPFICITPGRGLQLSTPVQSYDSAGQTMDIAQPTEYHMLVDCYGPQAADWARILTMALRSSFGCDQLPGIAPLYADDAVQSPLVDGEDQYEDHWRFESVVQYTPKITVGQESALALVLGVLNVDATYHP